MSTTTYSVQGMTCGGCAAKVTGVVKQVDGVEDTSVDLAAGTVTVVGPGADHDAVRAAITQLGYQVA
ncbi:heavy-metal-associated domain-containing protein [Antribacter gilvus]|uniref:heavy-metal-associated domain-containing protein n=1 Tax=Antribacter gilvus TaxID=2304675 RepID=UPI000F793592|nr:heavy metal-associated domain-containing protein [Antribacter gilvus]